MTSRVLSLAALFCLTACFLFRGDPPASVVDQSPVAALKLPPKPAPKPRDPELLRLVKLATQADQIQREAWWVISGEKRSAPRSAFGKLSRAALTALDERLSSKGIFNCDRYASRPGAPGLAWSGVFFEICEKGGDKEIASWAVTGPRRGRAEFVPQNLGEVLGVSASIFGKRLICDLTWDEADLIEEMNCPNWEQDRESNLIRLDVYRYKRNNGQILKLKGKILQGMTAVRKIETEVPLEGKITVVETELNPPPPDPVKAPVKPLVDGKKPAQRGVPEKALRDPDLPKDPNAPAEPPGIPQRRAQKGPVHVLTPEEQYEEQMMLQQQMLIQQGYDPSQMPPGYFLPPGVDPNSIPPGMMAPPGMMPGQTPMGPGLFGPPPSEPEPMERPDPAQDGIPVAPPPAAPVAPSPNPDYIPGR